VTLLVTGEGLVTKTKYGSDSLRRELAYIIITTN